MTVKKTSTGLVILGLLIVMACTAGKALADYREIYLNKAVPTEKAHGYISFEHAGFIFTDRLLHVNVYSLKPDTPYDVWILDRETGKIRPAGLEGKNTFITNPSGAGHYTYWTTEFDLGWNKLIITEHLGKGERPRDARVVLWAWMYQ